MKAGDYLKKKLFVFAVSALIVASLGIYYYSYQSKEAAMQEVRASSELDEDPPLFAQGSHAEGFWDIQDLKKNAALIVNGTVISQAGASDVGVAIKFKVTKTFKGKELREIIIYESKSEAVLTTGEQYYLFLGRQSDDQENLFYVKGGIQGIFVIRENKVSAREHLMRNSMNDLLKEKEKGTSDVEFFEDWIQQ
ncbi:hypothetical protein D7Z26_21905 [Cohnella endophytica]|uniref:Uncharacterized protein n=1 Tax=Cohnella endophytica TaxID=2419778 RepID=A0A494XJZ3_9BACL|nr:hypothetical protein [Cohnella endophytica]RKP47873.1 hypothetical protein D7Z26_21905 [Cohnella endophytica]